MEINFKYYEEIVCAREIIQLISEQGFNAVIAGGAVRDIVMGRIPADLDIATNMPVSQLESLFHCHDIGKSKDFGLVTVHHRGHQFEVAQFRMDGKYSDGRRPDSVDFVNTFEGDSSRRDFTCNAMGITKGGEILDYHGGMSDIQNRLIRTVGDPEVRFQEDYLRMIRALRFGATLNFDISPDIFSSIERNAEKIRLVSPERVRDELFKAAKVQCLDEMILTMMSTGLLAFVMPEVAELVNVEQTDFVRLIHMEGNAFVHTMMVVSNSPDRVDSQFAALFHDLGKAETRVEENGKVSFLGHEEKSVPIAEKVMRRLCFPSDLIEKVKVLVGNHMRFHNMNGHVSKAIRKLVREVGEDAIYPLLDLSEADSMSTFVSRSNNSLAGGTKYVKVDSCEMRRKVKEVLECSIPVRRNPVLSGKEIMSILSLSPGPIVGKVKSLLIELEDDLAVDGQELTVEAARQAVVEFGREMEKTQATA